MSSPSNFWSKIQILIRASQWCHHRVKCHRSLCQLKMVWCQANNLSQQDKTSLALWSWKSLNSTWHRCLRDLPKRSTLKDQSPVRPKEWLIMVGAVPKRKINWRQNRSEQTKSWWTQMFMSGVVVAWWSRELTQTMNWSYTHASRWKWELLVVGAARVLWCQARWAFLGASQSDDSTTTIRSWRGTRGHSALSAILKAFRRMNYQKNKNKTKEARPKMKETKSSLM